MTKTTFFLLKCPGKTDLRVSKDGDDGGGESSTNRYETLLESVTTRHHALERAESVNEDLKEKLVSFQCNSLLKEHSLKTQLAKVRENFSKCHAKQQRAQNGIQSTRSFDLIKL